MRFHWQCLFNFQGFRVEQVILLPFSKHSQIILICIWEIHSVYIHTLFYFFHTFQSLSFYPRSHPSHYWPVQLIFGSLHSFSIIKFFQKLHLVNPFLLVKRSDPKFLLKDLFLLLQIRIKNLKFSHQLFFRARSPLI